MPKILVTGGCGYIGSHTIIDLLENGFEVICADSLIRADISILQGICAVTGQMVHNYAIDLRNKAAVLQMFEEHTDIAGVIHFAAFKSVPESVHDPILYYDNNINSLLNILSGMQQQRIPHIIFSSSCSVYGNPDQLPVDEATPFGRAESPYAHTKQIGEGICKNFLQSNEWMQAVMLRYFNPAGAHPSLAIGEVPQKGAYNVVPLVMESLLGLRGTFTVLGDDYDTPDGSCVRDYIHVCDVAHAHTKALQYLLKKQQKERFEIFNIGIGAGISVLQLLDAFERANQIKVPRLIGKRREGDVAAIYANPQQAFDRLQWQPRYSIEEMMYTAWQWEKARHQLVPAVVG